MTASNRRTAALADSLRAVGEVVVVAPDRERSATGHSLTLTRPLRVATVKPGWYSVDGTPTDCVTLAVMELLPRKPHLVAAESITERISGMT